ncbi:Ran-binding protein 9 [Globodera pallida]|nr:Ran-binding protein 9 [Globodera pallida]
MRTFHFLDAVCLFVVAAFILLETDASPKTSTTNTKLENEPAEQKNPGLTLDNIWNSNACHPHLTLSEPVQTSDSKRSKSKKQPSDSTPSETKRLLVVKYKPDHLKFSSVFAVQPIPKTGAGIFYYEVTILKRSKLFISIGLCTTQMPLDKEIGDIKSYAYRSHGAFVADSESMLVDSNGIKIPFISAGDTVGCGVDFKNNKALFYTLNGKRLGPTGKIVDSAVELFPCVTLSEFGDEMKANFGPKFQYRTANGI